jgi:hypothetical protein
MKRMQSHYLIISIILLFHILVSLFILSSALPPLPPYLAKLMPSRVSRSQAQEVARLRQEKDAMGAVTLQNGLLP